MGTDTVVRGVLGGVELVGTMKSTRRGVRL